MASLNEMRAERARIFEEIKALNERAESEDRDFTGEEQETYDRMNAEIDDLAKEISSTERTERIASVRASLERVDNPPRTGNTIEDDFLSRWQRFLNGETHRFEVTYTAADVRAAEQRDLLTSTAGAPIPTSFVRSLREHLIENSAIRQTNTTVITTQSGEDLQVPKTTAHPTATLIGEAAAITENDPTLDLVTLQSFKYANLAQLSREFVQDEAVNVLEYLARHNGIAIGNASGAHFVTGTGTGQPRGVQTAAGVGVTGATGQTTTVTSDDLIDLFHSVVSGYRIRSFWLMNDATVATVRKLKDGNQQYLWQPGLQADQPDLLLGRPVVDDPNMPEMAANAKSILFGDFSGYYIRDVGSVAFERSDEFAFNTDLVTFRAIARTDGDLVDENSVKAYQNSAT